MISRVSSDHGICRFYLLCQRLIDPDLPRGSRARLVLISIRFRSSNDESNLSQGSIIIVQSIRSAYSRLDSTSSFDCLVFLYFQWWPMIISNKSTLNLKKGEILGSQIDAMQERSDSDDVDNRNERRHSPKRRSAEDLSNELLEVYFLDDHEPTTLYIYSTVRLFLVQRSWLISSFL